MESSHIIISSDGEEDKEQLKQAIALSLADQAIESRQTPSASGLNAIMDRKAMEEARLARAAKRARSVSPPDTSSKKAPRLDTTSIQLPSGARLNMIVQVDQDSRKTSAANAATARLNAEGSSWKVGAQTPKSSSGLASRMTSGEVHYPHGVVKKTWAFKHERTGDDMKLEEVLESSTLRTAVLSAFQWDVDWVCSKLRIPPNGGSTKCVFIMQAKERELRDQMLRETADMRDYLRLCFPPMEGQTHCMHSKLQLLFHPKKLRVAIPTANLLNFDWGETGVMENSVWLIDLPRLPQGEVQDMNDMPSFGKDLVFFLEKQGLDENIIRGLLNFDFAATEPIAFVHTVGGQSHTTDAERTGLPGLARAIRELGLQTNDLNIDFAASSIGSLNDGFLNNIYHAAKGEDMLAGDIKPAATAQPDFFKPSSEKKAKEPKPKGIRERFCIYFPTHETVKASTAGAAGSICLSRKWYEDMPFPRSIFRDYISTRHGLLSHNKILYARGKQQLRPNEPIDDIAWAYVGSANMSESAWGKVVRDKKTKRLRVNCRNWECGVVLPVRSRKAETAIHEGEEKDGNDASPVQHPLSLIDAGPLVGMEVFDDVVKPPFEYPGKEYGNREPWYFQEYK